ncbi:antibiotic biosynthesis monooxygenase family protein [Saccharibacter floricola]|uniref:ABM domain-containing protein n=1 Tax=Saccharibacter floricola DSM 15669 TaxID=1123227 RepID=A0ABQ0NWG9_9PROT|nr:antibiotic biosynthesis monooxygenase [Saccharibacter floricola]GBQ05045.1 hypothetical protein AA15669_0276 [Saccharibacter floricola DSM 15669]
MYIAMNRFRVKPDCSEAFEQRWQNREVFLNTVPGFVSFQLLRGPEHDDHTLYASHTIWETHDAFIAWTQSEQFRQAHRHAGEGPSLTVGRPVFEGFDVLQELHA